MNRANAIRLNSTLPATARVIDVGGGGSAFPRADYVIDLCPFDKRDKLGTLSEIPQRYTAETWVLADLCDHTPWPFPDKFFDYATCSHVLEDVRDPIWLCSEMSRIAKAGYIETPSRILEQTKGIEHPLYAGYAHHRWLITQVGGALEFRHKAHSLHALNEAVIGELGPNQRINPKHEILVYEWTDNIRAAEIPEFGQTQVEDEMIAFAARYRSLPDLAVSAGLRPIDRLKRWIYWRRLRAGRRHSRVIRALSSLIGRR
jgi:hypothetical protein